MDKRKVLADVREAYRQGENIINYLKNMDGRDRNSVEDILISHDFQAGSYSAAYERNPESSRDFHREVAHILNQYIGDVSVCTIMEAGIGEATTMAPVLKLLNRDKIKAIYGFDISWSRIKYAERFLDKNDVRDGVYLFLGELGSMPIQDCSVDIIYTVHAIEPNEGREKEILSELYRAAGRYLILFEPLYELADNESRRRMREHGYVTNLYQSALELGYKVVKYEQLKFPLNPLNPTGVMVIKKDSVDSERNPIVDEEYVFGDPITKKALLRKGGVYYCEHSMLMYPVVEGVPCLLEDNAIIATKFMEFYK